MNRGLLGQTPRNTVQADDEPDQQLEAPVTDGAKPSTRAIIGVVLNRSSTDANKLQCPEPECEELFSTEEDIRKHLLANIKKHGHCGLCPADRTLKSTKTDSLKNHIKAHIENGRKEECDTCHKFFPRADLAGHKMVKHGSQDEQKYPCTDSKCKTKGKSFKNAKELNKHVKECHSEVIVKCEHCGSELKESSLRVHLELACTSNPARRPREKVRCPKCSNVVLRQGFPRHMEGHGQSADIESFLDQLEVVDDASDEE